jgi:hypothetical protein
MCFTVESQTQKLQPSLSSVLHMFHERYTCIFYVKVIGKTDNIVGNLDRIQEGLLLNQLNTVPCKRNVQSERKIHG